jgi:hypothetical protein
MKLYFCLSATPSLKKRAPDICAPLAILGDRSSDKPALDAGSVLKKRREEGVLRGPQKDVVLSAD